MTDPHLPRPPPSGQRSITGFAGTKIEARDGSLTIVETLNTAPTVVDVTAVYRSAFAQVIEQTAAVPLGNAIIGLERMTYTASALIIDLTRNAWTSCAASMGD
ncbi:MAG: hypothetical protein ACKVQT_31930 [Burkholderiales bacterium]